MKISVIIPLFNKENVILKTIDSVLNQDYESFEVIVVDDGSTDSSSSKVLDVKSEKIHLVSKHNGGPASARNYGVNFSTGDWIVFLDADDFLEPYAIRHFAYLIENNPQYSFFCCNHYLYNGEQKFLYSSAYKRGVVHDNFLAWNSEVLMPRAGAAIFRKTLIKKYPFNESLRRYEDAESLFDIMRTTKCYRDPAPVMSYNISTLSASAPCKDISEDFIGHLSIEGKSLMEQYAIYMLYKQGLQLYPNDMKRLYGNGMFNRRKFWGIGMLVRILKAMKWA